MLQQGAFERGRQPRGELAISRVVKRQLAIELQHKLLAVQRIKGGDIQLGDLRIDLAERRIGRRVEIVGERAQFVRGALHFTGVAVVEHPAERQGIQVVEILSRKPV